MQTFSSLSKKKTTHKSLRFAAAIHLDLELNTYPRACMGILRGLLTKPSCQLGSNTEVSERLKDSLEPVVQMQGFFLL